MNDLEPLSFPILFSRVFRKDAWVGTRILELYVNLVDQR